MEDEVPTTGRAWRAARRVLSALVVLGTAAFLAQLLLLAALRWVDPPGSALMLQRALSGDAPRPRYDWVDYEAIGDSLKMAVIAAEDQRFIAHHGVDPDAISDAWRANRGGGGRVRGGSTITQQVAKNLLLWPGRSYVRKALEAGVALELELLWPKRRILEVYLNIAEWDDGVYGAEAAAQHHFGVAAAALDASQACQLAATLPNPRVWRASRPTAYGRRRAAWICDQARQLGGADYLRRLERGRGPVAGE